MLSVQEPVFFKKGLTLFGTDLLFLDDIDARLDIGKGVHGGKDGLPLVLLVELASRPSALCEGCGVHKTPQVEVLLKVS